MGAEKEVYDAWMRLFACDDPYWNVPTRYMDRSRVGQQEKKLDKFERRYPKCIDDLFIGVPTYYCVLCVTKNDPPDAIKEAYERKKKHSVYPDEVIERAYEMLSDDKKRRDYDEIIRVFMKLLSAFTAKEKQELIEEHEDWLKEEKKRATFGYIMEKRHGWLYLFHRGAPTLYELLKVDRAKLKTGAAVECKNKHLDRRLMEEVCAILNNPQLRFEYDFMLDTMDTMAEKVEGIRREEPFLEGKDAAYLLLLKYNDYLEKYGDIMDNHRDWVDYTDDKTFYNLLNIDADSIPADKRDAENWIRSAYKDKERTPEVNLAYNVLKNFRLKEDYDWLLKHGKWVSMVLRKEIEETDDARINEALKIADALV